MPDLLSLERRDEVALVTLRRPEKRNALSIELRLELAAAFADLSRDEGIGCVVLTGAGSAFCAGMDVTQFGGDLANRRRLVETSTAAFEAVGGCERPVIAAVNGPALAGGFALALLCDLRLAGERAQFGFPELPRGIPPSYAAARAVLAATVELGDRFDGGAEGRLSYLLNPRFILTCSDPLWRGIRELALARGWPVHTHALEQVEEAAAVLASRGRDEIEYFDEAGVLATDLRLAHGVWLQQGHLERLRRGRASVIHCPSSNLKLGSGVADLLALRGAGLPVGVGADGAACNNGLDAFAEVRLAALLQKLKHGPDAFSGLDALRLATSEGARALGREGEVGSVEVGKAADLLVLDGERPELWAAPEADPHDRVAFGASRTAVRHVLVDGELLVEDGRLTRLDLGEIRRRAAEHLAQAIVRSGVDLEGRRPRIESSPQIE